MGLQVIHMSILALLSAPVCSAAPVSDSFTVSVERSVSVRRGGRTILPCSVLPSQNAEGLEVRWYRDDRFDTPIILHRAQQADESQDSSYVGRVSFGLKDAASGGMKAGDVSLSLLNVTIKDAGVYICYVSSDQGYDKGETHVSVIETGTSPFLSAEWMEGNLMKVSCESSGWHPQPQLRWTYQNQEQDPNSLQYSTSPSGLMSVHSFILVPSSSEVSCSVGFSDQEVKVARVHLGNPPQSSKQVAGWVAFVVLLLIVSALAALLFFKRRDLFCGKNDESRSYQVDGNSVNEPLLNKSDIKETTALTEAKKYYVNVTLDKTKNPYIIVKDRKLRDNQVDFPDGKQVTCLTAVKGTPGITSGQHYWEVSLGITVLGFKKSWWVGVTSSTDFPQKPYVAPTTSDGFWFLSSSPDRADSFQFSTEPKVFLPVHSRPQTVGVYLNYVSGELSFYDVESEHVIGSLTAKFKGEVFPLFNPGKNDQAPMEILHKPVQAEYMNTENCVEPTAQLPESDEKVQDVK